MKFGLTILLSLFFLFANGQQRIGLELTSRLSDLSITAQYHKVVKQKWLLNAGISFGSMGLKFIDFENDTTLLINGYTIRSPYANVPISFIDTGGYNFQLFKYKTNAKGFGIQFGLGFFHEFNIVHGFRFNLNAKIYCAQSEISAGYFNISNRYFTSGRYIQQYFVGSISPEIHHTIRLSGRTTFCYGIKLPYYFSLDKGKFNPVRNNELLSGFEGGVSVGLTYVIGKCD